LDVLKSGGESNLSTITIKRVYDPVSETDGFRILVDRLWPRGIAKEKAQVDLWAKDVTPSSALRKEYHQNLHQFEEFRNKYNEELSKNEGMKPFIAIVRQKLKTGNVTFLYAAKNMEANHAFILKEWVEKDGNGV
jgi:uncharacterized protein YeaO (DUF488 family)